MIAERRTILAARTLISASEAARILGKERWTIWNWRRLGKLEAAETVVVGGREQAMYDLAYIQQKADDLRQEKDAKAVA